MERKIGERFNCDGVMLEVVEHNGCEGCYFSQPDCARVFKTTHACSIYRADGKSVIFKKVDKTFELLVKAHAELVRCGIESEIVDEIEKHLNKTK